ncbi:MAG TPA: hypothetical protein VEH77_07785 [Roseiarcus sp.]|nr:hypothetical protein [Roseiarcus sp.]
MGKGERRDGQGLDIGLGHERVPGTSLPFARAALIAVERRHGFDERSSGRHGAPIRQPKPPKLTLQLGNGDFLIQIKYVVMR